MPIDDNHDAAIRAIPERMIAAWNAGDGDAFAAPFTDTASFVAFEGTQLHGRAQIAAFHRDVFANAAKGTRLQGGVEFVRHIGPDAAVMHAYAQVTLPGAAAPSPSRDSMQLFVAVRRDGAWRVEAVMNARRLTLERQSFLDDLDSLPADGQREVMALVAALKRRTSQ